MYKNKSFLAFIPARGGSKRLPNKNLLNLAGKPLVAWTIEAAKKSQYVHDIILSSDDDRILEIGRDYGITALKRPDYLATDEAKTVDVVMYHLNQIFFQPDFIILLQPTSPLRTSLHIDKAIEFLQSKKADAIISVCEVDYPVEWCNILPEDGNLANFIQKEFLNLRSQDLPKRYKINGALYIIKTEKFLKEKTFFLQENIHAYIMDKFSSIDIDDEFDFRFSEFLITNAHKDTTHS